MVANNKEQDTPVPQLFLASQLLECVQSYKYLGFIITSRSEHIQSICNEWKNCGLTLSPVLPECRLGYPPLILYLSCIRPHLEYACTVWNPYLGKEKTLLEAVQKFACKICCKNWNMGVCWLSEYSSLQQTEVTKAGCINVCTALTSNSTAESLVHGINRGFYTHTRSGLAPRRQNCFQSSWSGRLLKGDGEWLRAAEMYDQYGALLFLFCSQST